MATTIYLIRPETYPVATSYLLDTYSAAAAYSLRQLKTGVTNVVRVRRSSDNAESDFSASDITDGTLASFCSGTDGFVVTWYDQSGNGYDATNATASGQPRIVSSGVVETKGGLPAIYADGGDRLTASAITEINTEPFGIYSVSSGNATGSIYGIWDTSSGIDRISAFNDTRISPHRNLEFNTTGSGQWYDLSTAYNDTNQRLLVSQADASLNVSTFDNSNAGGSGTTSGTYLNDFWVMFKNRGYFLTGTMQEVIVFGTDESANRTSIESDINTYYSIY